MAKIPEIYIEHFNYSLPDDRIARYPLNQRDQSKLLIWKNGIISDEQFIDLDRFLPEKSLLVFNNTRVIRARLYFRKSTGALIEIFVLDPEDPADYAQNFQQTECCSWKCLVGNQKKWKSGTLSLPVEIEGEKVCLSAKVTGETENGRLIEFSWDNKRYDFATVLDHAGRIPIPPYLNRDSEASDLDHYQTVYSKIKGSVAAPTAGLHFTEEVFERLQKKDIQRVELTLHVGAGTFKPVKSETIDDHQMHNEQIVVNRETIKALLSHQGPVVAVGTTSVRSLETLYWLGVRIAGHPDTKPARHQIEQWDPYEQTSNLSRSEALQALLDHLENHNLSQLIVSTRIFIIPGYRFRMIDGLLTNFHQPQSTLLLLVTAFIGEDWKTVYQHALDQGYRFLSYGDSNLYLH